MSEELEALECFERIGTWELANSCLETVNESCEYDLIKKILQKAQKQKRVFGITTERDVDFYILADSETVEDYNSRMNWGYRRLTEDEYNLLKRWTANGNE